MTQVFLPTPHTVDLNLIGKCNLRCPICWGPPHEQGAILSADQWNEIICDLARRGTKAIILTGGEPLLRRDLLEICKYTKSQGLRITLSTNGILLRTQAPLILPYVDEIGLPLDGADQDSNNRIRVPLGWLNHFESVVPVLTFVHANYPHIDLTVRTIVSKQNVDGVLAIGGVLQKLNLTRTRWKLYHFAPIGYGAQVTDDYWISKEAFEATITRIREEYPQLNIATLDHSARGSRYLHILPNGDAMTPTDTHQELHLGNALHSLDEVIANLTGKVDFSRNKRHGIQTR